VVDSGSLGECQPTQKECECKTLKRKLSSLDMAILLFSRTIVKRVSQSLTEIITIPRNRAGRS